MAGLTVMSTRFKGCIQGGPLQSFKLFNALNSECGLPLYEVTADDITVLFLTTTVPTEGFNLVRPIFLSAI